MNKKQAIKEIRDIIMKYIFIEMEKMKDCSIEIEKKSPTAYCNYYHIDISLYNSNYDELIFIRIHTSVDDNIIHIYKCPDSLYESIASYDNYKFNIRDCR